MQKKIPQITKDNHAIGYVLGTVGYDAVHPSSGQSIVPLLQNIAWLMPNGVTKGDNEGNGLLQPT